MRFVTYTRRVTSDVLQHASGILPDAPVPLAGPFPRRRSCHVAQCLRASRGSRPALKHHHPFFLLALLALLLLSGSGSVGGEPWAFANALLVTDSPLPPATPTEPWQVVNDSLLPYPIFYPAIAVLNNSIVLLGGCVTASCDSPIGQRSFQDDNVSPYHVRSIALSVETGAATALPRLTLPANLGFAGRHAAVALTDSVYVTRSCTISTLSPVVIASMTDADLAALQAAYAPVVAFYPEEGSKDYRAHPPKSAGQPFASGTAAVNLTYFKVPLDRVRVNASCTAMPTENKILIVGGFLLSSGRVTASVDAFHLVTRKYETNVAYLTAPVLQPSVATSTGMAAVTGGWTFAVSHVHRGSNMTTVPVARSTHAPTPPQPVTQYLFDLLFFGTDADAARRQAAAATPRHAIACGICQFSVPASLLPQSTVTDILLSPHGCHVEVFGGQVVLTDHNLSHIAVLDVRAARNWDVARRDMTSVLDVDVTAVRPPLHVRHGKDAESRDATSSADGVASSAAASSSSPSPSPSPSPSSSSSWPSTTTSTRSTTTTAPTTTATTTSTTAAPTTTTTTSTTTAPTNTTTTTSTTTAAPTSTTTTTTTTTTAAPQPVYHYAWMAPSLVALAAKQVAPQTGEKSGSNGVDADPTGGIPLVYHAFGGEDVWTQEDAAGCAAVRLPPPQQQQQHGAKRQLEAPVNVTEGCDDKRSASSALRNRFDFSDTVVRREPARRWALRQLPNASYDAGRPDLLALRMPKPVWPKGLTLQTNTEGIIELAFTDANYTRYCTLAERREPDEVADDTEVACAVRLSSRRDCVGNTAGTFDAAYDGAPSAILRFSASGSTTPVYVCFGYDVHPTSWSVCDSDRTFSNLNPMMPLRILDNSPTTSAPTPTPAPTRDPADRTTSSPLFMLAVCVAVVTLLVALLLVARLKQVPEDGLLPNVPFLAGGGSGASIMGLAAEGGGGGSGIAALGASRGVGAGRSAAAERRSRLAWMLRDSITSIHGGSGLYEWPSLPSGNHAGAEVASADGRRMGELDDGGDDLGDWPRPITTRAAFLHVLATAKEDCEARMLSTAADVLRLHQHRYRVLSRIGQGDHSLCLLAIRKTPPPSQQHPGGPPPYPAYRPRQHSMQRHNSTDRYNPSHSKSQPSSGLGADAAAGGEDGDGRGGGLMSTLAGAASALRRFTPFTSTIVPFHNGARRPPSGSAAPLTASRASALWAARHEQNMAVVVKYTQCPDDATRAVITRLCERLRDLQADAVATAATVAGTRVGGAPLYGGHVNGQVGGTRRHGVSDASAASSGAFHRPSPLTSPTTRNMERDGDAEGGGNGGGAADGDVEGACAWLDAHEVNIVLSLFLLLPEDMFVSYEVSALHQLHHRQHYRYQQQQQQRQGYADDGVWPGSAWWSSHHARHMQGPCLTVQSVCRAGVRWNTSQVWLGVEDVHESSVSNGRAAAVDAYAEFPAHYGQARRHRNVQRWRSRIRRGSRVTASELTPFWAMPAPRVCWAACVNPLQPTKVSPWSLCLVMPYERAGNFADLVHRCLQMGSRGGQAVRVGASSSSSACARRGDAAAGALPPVASVEHHWTESMLCSVLFQVCAGLRLLHAQSPPILHGNVRGTNVLLRDPATFSVARRRVIAVDSAEALAAAAEGVEWEEDSRGIPTSGPYGRQNKTRNTRRSASPPQRMPRHVSARGPSSAAAPAPEATWALPWGAGGLVATATAPTTFGPDSPSLHSSPDLSGRITHRPSSAGRRDVSGRGVMSAGYADSRSSPERQQQRPWASKESALLRTHTYLPISLADGGMAWWLTIELPQRLRGCFGCTTRSTLQQTAAGECWLRRYEASMSERGGTPTLTPFPPLSPHDHTGSAGHALSTPSDRAVAALAHFLYTFVEVPTHIAPELLWGRLCSLTSQEQGLSDDAAVAAMGASGMAASAMSSRSNRKHGRRAAPRGASMRDDRPLQRAGVARPHGVDGVSTSSPPAQAGGHGEEVNDGHRGAPLAKTGGASPSAPALPQPAPVHDRLSSQLSAVESDLDSQASATITEVTNGEDNDNDAGSNSSASTSTAIFTHAEVLALTTAMWRAEGLTRAPRSRPQEPSQRHQHHRHGSAGAAVAAATAIAATTETGSRPCAVTPAPPASDDTLATAAAAAAAAAAAVVAASTSAPVTPMPTVAHDSAVTSLNSNLTSSLSDAPPLAWSSTIANTTGAAAAAAASATTTASTTAGTVPRSGPPVSPLQASAPLSHFAGASGAASAAAAAPQPTALRGSPTIGRATVQRGQAGGPTGGSSATAYALLVQRVLALDTASDLWSLGLLLYGSCIDELSDPPPPPPPPQEQEPERETNGTAAATAVAPALVGCTAVVGFAQRAFAALLGDLFDLAKTTDVSPGASVCLETERSAFATATRRSSGANSRGQWHRRRSPEGVHDNGNGDTDDDVEDKDNNWKEDRLRWPRSCAVEDDVARVFRDAGYSQKMAVLVAALLSPVAARRPSAAEVIDDIRLVIRVPPASMRSGAASSNATRNTTTAARVCEDSSILSEASGKGSGRQHSDGGGGGGGEVSGAAPAPHCSRNGWLTTCDGTSAIVLEEASAHMVLRRRR